MPLLLISDFVAHLNQASILHMYVNLHKQTCTLCLVTQSCPTLYDPMNCSPPGSSVHGDSSGKDTEVCFHVLLQGIFPTKGWNPGLPHYRQILYHLSCQRNPKLMHY